MPNHITNILHLEGPRSDIDQILGPATDPESFSFKYTVPPPEESVTDPEKWDWYNWQIENWGTKWDAYETLFNSNESDEDYAEINFQTAWSPPSAWLATTVEKFPNVEFKLYWLDEDYPTSGQILASNGQFTKDEYYGNDRDAAIEFVKEYFTDTYEMYEIHNRLDNLIEEINEVIHEQFPNVQIEITENEYDNDTDQDEPVQFKVTYTDTNTVNAPGQPVTDVFTNLEKSLQKDIMKHVKKIILEHGYHTLVKGQNLDVKKKNN